ncbi:hypothetical protein ACFLWL_03515 [Chloroflexota bacterium]
MHHETKWGVMSLYNFIGQVRSKMRLPQKVRLYDTTLRDGEQSTGLVLRKKDKIRIAEALDALGVQRIEASMPVVSPEDREAVEEIAHMGLKAEIWGFARAVKADIAANIDCGIKHLMVEIPTSDLKQKAYGMNRETVLRQVLESISYAKEHGIYVAYFAVDATRSDPTYLRKVFTSAVNQGHADEVVVVDTCGVAIPEAMSYLLKQVKKWVDVPVHVHCHNDFGLGVANTLASVAVGAEWAHVTVNGIGEKCGNVALEELALALYLLYGMDVGIKYDKLLSVSRIVEEVSGMRMASIKPIVGEHVFKRETGGVVQQLMNYPPAAETFSPELVGGQREVVFGKKSGKYSVLWKLREMGISASEEQIGLILKMIKSRAEERKGLLLSEEVEEITVSVLQKG